MESTSIDYPLKLDIKHKMLMLNICSVSLQFQDAPAELDHILGLSLFLRIVSCFVLPPILLSDSPFVETYLCQIGLESADRGIFVVCSTHFFVGQWLTIYLIFCSQGKKYLNIFYNQTFKYVGL